MKAQKIALTGIMAAIMCLLAPLSVPSGGIPVTLATFAVYIISCIAEPKNAVSAVIIYILLGAAGLPVFSSFRGGFQVLAGITGGYIIGYIPCALAVSLLINKFPHKKFVYPLSMISGTAICCVIGALWYALQSDVSFSAAITAGVLPFIIGDMLKIAAASVLGYTLRKRLNKIRS